MRTEQNIKRSLYKCCNTRLIFLWLGTNSCPNTAFPSILSPNSKKPDRGTSSPEEDVFCPNTRKGQLSTANMILSRAFLFKTIVF